jgi:copper chaperone CopZ
MKKIFASLAFVSAIALSGHAADVTVKLTDVHLCCKTCVNIAQKTVAGVSGVTADVDQASDSITLTGPDTATVQKATDALTAAGYFGKSSDPSIKVDAETGATGKKVHTLKITGMHVCCPKCVKAVNQVLAGVPGVTGNDATKGAKSFSVTGDFNDKDAMDAFQKAGLTGKVSESP